MGESVVNAMLKGPERTGPVEYSILVIGNDEWTRQLEGLELDSHAPVVGVADVSAAISLAPELGSVCAVLLPAELPDVETVAREFRTGCGHVCVVVAGPREEVVPLAQKVGAYDHISLPEDADRLAGAVRNAAEAGWLGYERERLHELVSRFGLAIAGTEAGLWEWRPDQNQLFVSREWAHIMGRRRTDLDREGPGIEKWLNCVHRVDRPLLQQRLDSHLAGDTEGFYCEFRVTHLEGHELWMRSMGRAERNEAGDVVRMAGLQINISASKEVEQQLEYELHHDSMTALPNRALLYDRLERIIQRSRRRPEHNYAVLFLDLDRFKLVNESLGHHYGDLLLVHIAQRIEQCIRKVDSVARFGDDEFCVLLDDLAQPSDVTIVLDRIHDVFSRPFLLDGTEVYSNASIGVAYGDQNYERPEDIIRDADTAMYRAKRQGGGGVAIFEPEMHSGVVDRLAIENALRSAVSERGLHLNYQPIIDISSDRVVGFEALVRWQHETMGFVRPDHFIPVAEDSGLILAIGRFVLEEACRQVKSWQDSIPGHGELTVSVNVSGKELLEPGWATEVQAIREAAGLSAESLNLEITETAVVENQESAAEVLQRLQSEAIRIYLDDFGTGYSSLSYLHQLPIDTLKIDRSFVNSMTNSSKEMNIVLAIINLATNLGIRVVAEGVETEEQLRELRGLGCHYAQGYYLSRPLAPSDVPSFVEEWAKARGH